MKKTRYHAVVPARSSQELTLDTLADAAQVHPEFIEMLVGHGLLEPIRETETEMLFLGIFRSPSAEDYSSQGVRESPYSGPITL